MEIVKHRQLNPVSDEVQALIAVVRPVLIATLASLKHEVSVVKVFGTYDVVN